MERHIFFSLVLQVVMNNFYCYTKFTETTLEVAFKMVVNIQDVSGHSDGRQNDKYRIGIAYSPCWNCLSRAAASSSSDPIELSSEVEPALSSESLSLFSS